MLLTPEQLKALGKSTPAISIPIYPNESAD
jgi:hypothetical protein